MNHKLFIKLMHLYFNIKTIFLNNFNVKIYAIEHNNIIYYTYNNLILLIPFNIIKKILNYFNIDIIYNISDIFFTTKSSSNIINPVISFDIIHADRLIINNIFNNNNILISESNIDIDKYILEYINITNKLKTYNNNIPIIFIMNMNLKDSNMIRVKYINKGKIIYKYLYIDNNIFTNKNYLNKNNIFNNIFNIFYNKYSYLNKYNNLKLYEIFN